MSKTGSYRVALCQVPDLPELDERRSAGCHSDKDIGAKNTYRLRGGMFIQAARHRSDSIECLPGCAAAWLEQRNFWSGGFGESRSSGHRPWWRRTLRFRPAEFQRVGIAAHLGLRLSHGA